MMMMMMMMVMKMPQENKNITSKPSSRIRASLSVRNMVRDICAQCNQSLSDGQKTYYTVTQKGVAGLQRSSRATDEKRRLLF